MKTLLNVEREIWAKVKFYAALKGVPLTVAVQSLLDKGLEEVNSSNLKTQMEDGKNEPL
jgi:hypothetical protein